MSRTLTRLVLTAAVCAACGFAIAADDKPSPAPPQPAAVDAPRWAPAVNPKPLSEHVKKGLGWLVNAQHADGGWDQGEQDQTGRQNEQQTYGKSNVGDTAVATLALLRSGSSAGKGDHADHIRRGIEYILGSVERSSETDMWVTENRGTRLQSKLGQYADTFLASLVLTEVKGTMPTEEGNARIEKALAKIVSKIEKNQREDGTWEGQGWATALQQGLAAKAINRAAQAGVEVDDKVRERTEQFAGRNFDAEKKSFDGKGSAGVDLYAAAATVGAVTDSDNTNKAERRKLQEVAANAPTPEARADAQEQLKRIDRNAEAAQAQQAAVVQKLGDERFVAGFGNNGGEEFLSFMAIGEALVVKGGEEWTKFDKQMTEKLNAIQNADGSWSGHHCITGKTFCTSAALLTLMVDRAPVPLAGDLKRN